MVRDGRIPGHGPKGNKINPPEADAARAAFCDPDKIKGAAVSAGGIEAEGGKRRKNRQPQRLAEPEKQTNKPATENTETPSHPETDSDSEDKTLNEARRLGELLKNEKRKLELEELRGRLIDKAKAKHAVFSLSRQFREYWQNWPSRVGPLIASELGIDPRECQRVLDKAVREHLADMADAKLP